MINRLTSGLIKRAFCSNYKFNSATLKIKEFEIARREFNEKDVDRFMNKNYYNPDYMYNTEGPEILRLYNSKDNTEALTFTDVLDSAYNNVTIHNNTVV